MRIQSLMAVGRPTTIRLRSASTMAVESCWTATSTLLNRIASLIVEEV